MVGTKINFNCCHLHQEIAFFHALPVFHLNPWNFDDDHDGDDCDGDGGGGARACDEASWYLFASQPPPSRHLMTSPQSGSFYYACDHQNPTQNHQHLIYDGASASSESSSVQSLMLSHHHLICGGAYGA